MAPVRGHWTQGEGVDSGPASRALPQLTRSTSRQIVTVRVCARPQVEKNFSFGKTSFAKLKKIHFGKRARRRKFNCLESRLGITDAIAPATSRSAIRRASSPKVLEIKVWALGFLARVT
jgi:hypothetical protein